MKISTYLNELLEEPVIITIIKDGVIKITYMGNYVFFETENPIVNVTQCICAFRNFIWNAEQNKWTRKQFRYIFNGIRIKRIEEEYRKCEEYKGGFIQHTEQGLINI